MLAAKTRANQIVQAIFETLLQPGEQLVVICCDGNPHSVVRSSHQQLQKSTFDSFHKGNTIKEIVVTDLDGDVVLLLPLFASVSPVCGDGNTLISQVVLEQNNRITGGLVTLLSGLPGFRIVLLLDKGFKVHRFNPQNFTLLQFCQTIPRLNGFVPLDVGDVYLDGNLLPGRIPDAINGRVRRLTCREANTSRTVIGFGRSAVEMSFGEQCQWGMAYKNKPVPPQMMEPIGDLCQNVSQLPKFFILLEVLATMKNRYHSPNRPSFPLPPGMTYRDIGLQARQRISFRNPLDPLEGVQWNADLYARPRRNDPH